MKIEHRKTQELLLSSLQNCAMEVRIPNLRRQADVIWHKEKIVFEIQCSHITSQEILSRTSDYSSNGYKVIWVLHDLLFNQRIMTNAERAMQGKQHLFSCVDQYGKGAIYSQRALILGKRRIKRGKKHPIFGTLPKEPFAPFNTLLKKLCL